jgi:uncharacterized protein YegJ (DUF2314 family)
MNSATAVREMNTLQILLLFTIAVLCACVAWWWYVGRNIPRYPPLSIDPGDPAMVAAVEKARGSLSRFRELLNGDVYEAQVKVPFVTSSGAREYLWGEVLTFADTSVTVRYLTPPVSHTGTLDRVHEHAVHDVEDWVVITHEGKIHGGYTQCVMFERARQLWGELPRELEKQASRYIESHEV